MPFQISLVSGKEGQITIPSVGVVAGITRSWSLRREESGPNAGSWTLHASLSYAHEKLMGDDTLEKRIILTIARDPTTKVEKKYRFESTDLKLEDASTLIGKGGTLWPVEQNS